MEAALEQARRGLAAGEVPIGAVLVVDGRIVSRAFNQPIGASDPTAHAEVLVLREAARLAGNYRLTGATVYVTVEPCLMCVGAAFNARLARIVYGPDEPKFGAVRSVLRAEDLRLNHRIDVVSGVLEERCRALMVDFFRQKRSGGRGIE